MLHAADWFINYLGNCSAGKPVARFKFIIIRCHDCIYKAFFRTFRGCGGPAAERGDTVKGLILSLAVLAAYVAATAVLLHVLRPKRPSRVFPPTLFGFVLIYAAAYLLTPPDLYCLPRAWQAAPAWLDALAGLVILLLNYISYIDWYFGFNGGFSMSLMLELLRAEGGRADSEELIRRYTLNNDVGDKITAWRLPRLEETGYLARDADAGAYRLTPKGRLVAWLTFISKRALNLGEGG